jgi:hypothetical protein
MDAMQRLDGGGGILGGAADGDVDELAHAEGGIEVVGALVVQHDELRRVGQPGGLRAVDAQQRRVAGDEVAHARAQLEDAALARSGRDQAVDPDLGHHSRRARADGVGWHGRRADGWEALGDLDVQLVPDQVDQPRRAQAPTRVRDVDHQRGEAGHRQHVGGEHREPRHVALLVVHADQRDDAERDGCGDQRERELV